MTKRFFRTIQMLVAGDVDDETKALVGPRTETLSGDDGTTPPYFVAEVSASLKLAAGTTARLPFGSPTDPVLVAATLFVTTDKAINLSFNGGTKIVKITPPSGQRGAFYMDCNELGDCVVSPQGTGFHDVFFAIVGSAPT